MPSTVPGAIWGNKAEGLREKDLEFLMDLRLWLEEPVRRRRGVDLATTLWRGGGVQLQMDASRMPASPLPSCVT